MASRLLLGDSPSQSAPEPLSSQIKALANEAASLLFHPTSTTSDPHFKNVVHQKIVKGGLYIPLHVLLPTVALLHCAVFYRVGYDSGAWREQELGRIISASIEDGSSADPDKLCDTLNLELEEAKMMLENLDKFMSTKFRAATPSETSSILTAYHTALLSLHSHLKATDIDDMHSLDALVGDKESKLGDKVLAIIEETIQAERKMAEAPTNGDKDDCDALFERIGLLSVLRTTLEVSAPIYVDTLQIVEDSQGDWM